MKYFKLIIVLTTLLLCGCGNSSEDGITETELKIRQITAQDEPTEKNKLAAAFWDSLKAEDQIPFRKDTVAYFFYMGRVSSVEWNGDFNSWGQDPGETITGINIEGTDLWYGRKTFPSDSRIDYKITLDKNDWILDPMNPHVQYSGFGPNSELRMPDWKEEPLTKLIPAAPKGILSEDNLISATALGYNISYKVYTPPGYENFNDLPVLYITDGHEYADPKLGNMPVVLDNLLFKELTKPVVAVFVGPLDPDDGNVNRRVEEMGINEDYLDFFIRDLIPVIDEEYKVSAKAEDRAILGTSLGGLNAAYFIMSKPEIFGKAAIQAPSFWYNQEIYSMAENAQLKGAEIYMSVGTIGDNLSDARQMKSIFDKKELDYTYLEVNEGHSWGAWSAQLDDILKQFYGK